MGTPERSGVADPTQNQVTLVGRVAAVPEERVLPSGDALVALRLVVARPRGGRPVPEGRRPQTVDTLDCVAWSSAARRAVGRFEPGDVVRVDGALRRRFWQAGGGPASRTEVEIAAARRLARAQASR